MNTKEYVYSWHLSLRVDRPVEGCAMRPHAYMYGKKLDSNCDDVKTPRGGGGGGGVGDTATTRRKEPPPQHEFSYRWFRGPLHEACAYERCPRRTSYSPHAWSKHALGGADCTLQCVSTQSSLYKCVFCNANCFVQAWKTQYTVPKHELMSFHGGASGNYSNNSRSNTPSRSRSGSVASSDDVDNDDGDSKSPNPYATPGTPRLYMSGGNSYTGDGGGHHSHSNSNTPYHDFGASDSNESWTEISREQIYMPGPDDVGRKLKMEATAYSTETGELLMSRVCKTDVVLGRAPDPVKRNLVTTTSNKTNGSSSSSTGAGPRFRVATYNVLAEIYATQQQYPYCDFWALSWDYRFQNILREILDAAPDVLCLQEIQADHYENHVYSALSDMGYEGVYKQKTRQSMGLAGKVDGCAIFWRRTKFHLVESYSIEFNEVAQRQATQVLGLSTRSDEGMSFLNRLSKDNVAQLVVLEFVQATSSRSGREMVNHQICVANTHLYSNKDFPDVKLWQCWQLLQELESFIMSRTSNLPLVICGDFNSTPDTAVYDLLSRQTVHPGHPDMNVANSDDVPNVLPDAMNITHSFTLGSAYQTVLGDEPWVTNYTAQFKGVLDYVWYSANNMRPLSAAPIPDETQLTTHGEALPSTEYSSDHIMLISDMQVMSNAGR